MIGNETCSTENPVDGCEWIVPEAARTGCWKNGIASAIAFVIGGSTSILCGYIGMSIAVYANARTATMCQVSWTDGFNTAFRAGSVMGFCLTSLGLLILYGSLWIFGIFIPWDTKNTHISEIFFECMTGYGLGGSSIALFGRVGGGIYTKAADVGRRAAGGAAGVHRTLRLHGARLPYRFPNLCEEDRHHGYSPRHRHNFYAG